jgi:hypothetical protein
MPCALKMHAPIGLELHEQGLHRVLSDWSGTGNLYRAIAAVAPESLEREWSSKDIERRAMRILLLECTPLLRRWPKSANAWRNYLPLSSDRDRFWSETPKAKVDWPKTRRRGWPPSAFAIRRRHRSTDLVTLSVLSWTLARLQDALSASQSLVGPYAAAATDLSGDVEHLLLRTLPILQLLERSDESRPTRDDVRAVRAAGWPWNVVGEVAQVFVGLERGGAEAMARRLLRPDGFPDALFQLSVLGAVLVACEDAGATATSLRPIGYMTDGPVYRVEQNGQEPWDLWCEAANCWSVYGLTDHYRELAATLQSAGGLAFQAKSIRPDILLARRGDRAVVFECKFPNETRDPGYVAHGLYQAAFYANQLRPAFGEVLGIAIGPSDLAPRFSHQQVGSIRIGIGSASELGSLVAELLGPSPSPTNRTDDPAFSTE